ncbi:MAG TPA: hypothetical protein VMG98_02400 [Verrucomicrobiae bacterium]|nr:hypothetical protein [Verrucomicrobiae bacterium]
MLDDYFFSVEDVAFAARANFAGGARAFYDAMDADECYAALSRRVRLNDGLAKLVYERVVALSKVSSDPDYENPLDVALAAYLRILLYSSPALAINAARVIADTPRIWWAEHLASKVRARAGSDILEFSREPNVEAMTSRQFSLPDSFLANRASTQLIRLQAKPNG